MAYISYDKLWRSAFYNIISAKKDRVQDIIFNQIKLIVNDSYILDAKKTTNFEPSNDEDVINKAYLHTKLSKKEGHSSLIEKNYLELNLHNNKQSVEAKLIEKAVKTIIQILYDQGLFD